MLGTLLNSLGGQLMLFLLGVLLVSPWGNFPLNDDWSYARVVDGLVNRGVIDVAQGWASMTLMSVVAWGSAFASVFGFSHAVLRVSTIVAALLVAVFLSKILRRSGATESEISTATGSLLANPVFFCLSLTFMTDVPFLMFALVTLLFCVRFLEIEQTQDYLLFLLFLAIAMMARQFAGLIAAAFGGAYVLTRGFSAKRILVAGLPVALCVGLYALHQFVLFPRFGFPDLRSVYVDQAAGRFSGAPHLIVLYFARSAAGLLITLGLYLSPFLILRIKSPSDIFGATRLTRSLTLLWTILVFGVMIQGTRLMPLIRNVVYDFGVGPPRLKDVLLNGTQVVGDAPTWFWLVVTAASFLLSCVLLQLVYRATLSTWKSFKHRSEKAGLQLFWFLFGHAYVLVIIVVNFFDRFLIVLIPAMMVWLIISVPAQRPATWQLRGAAAASLMIFLFSVAGTHDYHAWNKARWEALDRLTTKLHIPPQQIDGGIEFNGSTTYSRDHKPAEGKSWWWVVDDHFAVTFGDVPGYRQIDEVPFTPWLPWSRSQSIKIVQREG